MSKTNYMARQVIAAARRAGLSVRTTRGPHVVVSNGGPVHVSFTGTDEVKPWVITRIRSRLGVDLLPFLGAKS